MATAKKIIILEGCKFDYTPFQMKIFIEMWEQGFSINAIAKRFLVTHLDIGLLVMHCDHQDLIKPREGGLKGTKEDEPEEDNKIIIGDK